MNLFRNLALAACLGLAAAIPAKATPATCTLADGNGVGWLADVTVFDPVEFGMNYYAGYAIVDADVSNAGTGASGSGWTLVNETGVDIGYFDAGGSRHYFQNAYTDWALMSETGLTTCALDLVIYAVA